MVCAPAWICSLCVSVRARALARPSGRRRRRRPPRAVLVGLYEEPERPPNAVDYIKRYMGAPTGIDVEALRQENENARRAASPRAARLARDPRSAIRDLSRPAQLRKEREDLRATIDELNARLTEDKADDAA